MCIRDRATGVEVNEPDRIDYTFLKKYSVMVVEDTPELRSYLKETLSHYFVRVYVAKDGNCLLYTSLQTETEW